MNKASEILKKYNNFSSFCKYNISNCYTRIFYARWFYKEGKLLFEIEIKANRFLRKMVRSLIASTFKKTLNIKQFSDIVETKENLSVWLF